MMSNAGNHPAATNTLLASLDIPRDPIGSHLWISAGVAPSIIPQLAGLVRSNVGAICHLAGISRSTVTRKLKASSPLSSDQGTRIYGVVLALDAVLSLHEGDIAKCMSWINRPAWGLGGKKPAEILTTYMGVLAVIDLVGQIEHGVH